MLFLKRVVKGNVNNKQPETYWIKCPQCHSKTRTKVYEETVLVRFPLYCPKCKEEFKIDVVKMKMVLSE